MGVAACPPNNARAKGGGTQMTFKRKLRAISAGGRRVSEWFWFLHRIDGCSQRKWWLEQK